MELSTRARYAVEAIIDLAVNCNGKENVSLNAISNRVEISISYLEQLFAKLRRAGIVASVKGPKGGYQLGRDISEITILDIVNSVNEAIETRTCKGKVESGEGCRLNNSKCYSHHLWDSLLKDIRSHLKNVTLKDVIDNKSSLKFYH